MKSKQQVLASVFNMCEITFLTVYTDSAHSCCRNSVTPQKGQVICQAAAAPLFCRLSLVVSSCTTPFIAQACYVPKYDHIS